MKIVRLISRLFIGAVFSFSGFVKAVDPLGSTYKFQDYFEAFNLDILSPVALPLAILLSTTELVIGINLITGMSMKITSGFLLAFMFYFTILTFYIAVKNPVTDCGCFGDALILTNWQTFWKNIIFIVPAIFIFCQRNKYIPYYKLKLEWSLIVTYLVVGILISVYCIRNLPVLDFRPFKTGTSIAEGIKELEGAPHSIFENTLIYEKNGEKKTFALEDAPMKDSTWSFVETVSEEIVKGYEPPIHDFSIVSEEGTDITEDVLNNPEYSFLIISYDLTRANKKGLKRINKLVKSKKDQFEFYCMTSSSPEQIKKADKELNLALDYYSADEIMLKTVVRSNPGLVLIKNGSIMRKWHHRNIPDADELNEYGLVQLRNKFRKKLNNSVYFNFLFAFLLAVSLFVLITNRFCKKD